MKKVIVSTVLIALLVAGIVFLWRVFSPSEDGANQIQQQEQQGEMGLLLGIVSSRDGELISGATVRAVNRADARTEEVQSGADGSYNFSLQPGSYVLAVTQNGYERSIVEGVEINPHNNFRQDIKLTPKGQAGPPPAPGDPAGYIFGKGARDENEVKVILAAHGLLKNNEILSIIPVELTGDGLSVYYRDGQTVATYVDSFTGEPAWKVEFANGDVIYVQRTCANVVIPFPSKPVVAVASAVVAPVVAPVVCCPTPEPPEPVVTPEPTTAPVPSVPAPPTPPPTPSPTPKPTPPPTPPPTPKPTFGVACTAEPNFGYSPLNGVDILIEVSGTATGPITYWIDCMNDGLFEHGFSATTNESFLATDICNYPFPPEVGNSHFVLVKAQRQGQTAGSSCSIIVLNP